jgi:hypothetical protein
MNLGASCVTAWAKSSFMCAVLFASLPVSSQARAQEGTPNLGDAVWAAIAPALPYPPAADDDQPENGSAEPLWAVRRLHDAPAVGEVVANPLNAENQARAALAMSEILEAVADAERRAQLEFERLQARRSGGEMQGISLADEGVAGERADWNAKLTVEARAGAGPYEFTVPGEAPAAVPAPAGVAALIVAKPGEYDETQEAGARRRRYRPAEAWVYIGRAAKPIIERTGSATRVRVTRPDADASARAILEVRLRGNEGLVRQVIDKARWASLAAVVQ